MIGSDNFLDAMQKRHACKLFDNTKRISKEKLELILEYGRLSPSSFGMEPWRFLIVQSQETKEKLQPFCWDQPQIATCSDLVLIKTVISPLAPGSKGHL